jgi:hypothetical protein
MNINSITVMSINTVTMRQPSGHGDRMASYHEMANKCKSHLGVYMRRICKAKDSKMTNSYDHRHTKLLLQRVTKKKKVQQDETGTNERTN